MHNILPGFIDSLPEKPEFRKRIPMARYGKTGEIAEVIAFLASDGGATSFRLCPCSAAPYTGKVRNIISNQ